MLSFILKLLQAKKMLAETMSTIGTKLLTSAGHERIASSSEFRKSMAVVARLHPR